MKLHELPYITRHLIGGFFIEESDLIKKGEDNRQLLMNRGELRDTDVRLLAVWSKFNAFRDDVLAGDDITQAYREWCGADLTAETITGVNVPQMQFFDLYRAGIALLEQTRRETDELLNTPTA